MGAVIVPGMSYENDGNMGYILTVTYANGTTATAGSMIYGDREQVQAQAACLEAKAKAQGDGDRYGVAGIKPIRDVPIPADYTGPFHSLDDGCVAAEIAAR